MLRIIELYLCFWTQWARRGGAILALLFIGLAGFCGWYASQTLTVNADTTKMLDSGLEFQKTARELRDAFPQIKDELSVIVRAPTLDEVDAYASALYKKLKARDDIVIKIFSPTDEAFFRENGLMFLSERELEKRLTNLTKAAGLIEKLYDDPGIDTLFSTLAENDELAEKSELGAETLNQIYNDLAITVENSFSGDKTPFSWRGTLDDDTPPNGGYLRTINIVPVLKDGGLQPAKETIAGIKSEISALNAEFNYRTIALVTGNIALRGEELASVSRGIGTSFLLSFVMVFILLMFAFRSLYVSVLTLIGLIITLTFTSAYAAWAFGELNLVSVAFTVLLIGLGLDFFIHLLLHVQEYRANGQDRRVAMNSTMREIGGAMALAAPTTSLAFFSFLPTSFDGIAQLGAVAGVGVFIAFFVAVTFLPAALAIAPPPRPKPQQLSQRNGRSIFEIISIPIAVIVTLFGLFAVTYLPKARFDADPMALRDDKSESVRAFNMLFDDPSTYPYRLTRIVNSEQEAIDTIEKTKLVNSILSTRALTDFVPDNQDEKLELIDFASGSLAFVLTAKPGVRSGTPDGSGLEALLTRLQASMTGTNVPEGRDNASRDRLAKALKVIKDRDDPQTLLQLEKQIFRFWPDLANTLQQQFRADYVDYASLPESLTARYRTADGRWRVDMLPREDVRDPLKLADYVDSVEETFPDIAGGAIQSKKAGDIIAKSMLFASGLAFFIITLVLFIFVRRPLIVLMILFPLALAATLTVATGVILNIPFNYANVIVLPLLMGIGVDSGIHLVLRQEKSRKHPGINRTKNVYHTATPRAVFFSALTTVASFGSLILSSHNGTSSMGKLLTISIAYTLICTLIVLPAIFKISDLRSNKTSAYAEKS